MIEPKDVRMTLKIDGDVVAYARKVAYSATRDGVTTTTASVLRQMLRLNLPKNYEPTTAPKTPK